MKHIECCYPCKPPKRHRGCHETCPEYKKERKQPDDDNILKSQKHFEESLVPKIKISSRHPNKY